MRQNVKIIKLIQKTQVENCLKNKTLKNRLIKLLILSSILTLFFGCAIKDGHRTFTSLFGTKFEGEYKDGKKNGQGTLTFASGSKYVGEFKDGDFNGQGTYTFADGSKYVGEFKDDNQNGQGTLTTADGLKYVGEFKDNSFNGQGTVTFANGSKYVGEFKDTSFNGQGTLTHTDGLKYVGEFKDGYFNGQGTVTLANGIKHVGEFKDSKLNGKGSETFQNGATYIGNFKDGQKSGAGKIVFSDASNIEGEFNGSSSLNNVKKTSAEGMNLSGNLFFRPIIDEVLNKSNGEQAGLLENDIIVEYNGVTITDGIFPFISMIDQTKPQDQVTMKIKRLGVSKKIDLKGGKIGIILSEIPDFNGSTEKPIQSIVRQSSNNKNIIQKIDKTPPDITITSEKLSRGIKILKTNKLVAVRGKVFDESGVVEVIVSNKEATLDIEGNFTADIYLSMGDNKIVVTAMDRYENRSTKSFTITRAMSNITEPVAKVKEANTKRGIYYALIIGNNNYKYLPKLKTAKHDAREIRKVLENNYGFKTKLLLDGKRDEIVASINEYRRTLKEDDSFLIYYAGHGQFDKIAKKAYWLPIDSKNDDDTKWIIVDTITSNIKRIPSRHILIVADSCYSGTLMRTVSGKLDTVKNRKKYLKKMQKKPSRTLIASGGNEPVSDSGGDEHSIFAQAFIDGLKNIDYSSFTDEDLYFNEIKETVAGNADQTPEYKIIRSSGHSGGAFIFNKIVD